MRLAGCSTRPGISAAARSQRAATSATLALLRAASLAASRNAQKRSRTAATGASTATGVELSQGRPNSSTSLERSPKMRHMRVTYCATFWRRSALAWLGSLLMYPTEVLASIWRSSIARAVLTESRRAACTSSTVLSSIAFSSRSSSFHFWSIVTWSGCVRRRRRTLEKKSENTFSIVTTASICSMRPPARSCNASARWPPATFTT
mmetsp:Transcript_4071/g.14386  ORF Transcript_4071/g.14386 Transcript_4071/m.14386 type:complete len:206 (-) Transcript_4071:577-1194(-)